MEYFSKSSHERTENPSPSPSNSPTTTTNNGSITSLSSSNVNNHSNNNGVQTPAPKPTTPRSDPNNPYPTTFVQADTSNFKQVVQMLTGSTETIKQTPSRQPQEQRNFNIPPKKQGFKLYERRNCNNNSNSNLKNSLMINTLLPNFAANNSGFSPRKPEILSPSLLDFPSLTLSPVTPLNDDAFNKSMSPSPLLAMNNTPSLEEERAIAEKGFYLHPSPRDPAEPPQLLPLFPVTSPRVSGSAAASS
ncbi:VQ motif-containing protein 4-like [Humulus lupulus]|uniref:VQ motif-containing protein 4-like n=1 Tax=Humulus lupulus TaxID=3486 RepID=UPI002B40B5E6|nr:VQ motif-containing protein 4-like [Humulus lupulus]